MPSPNFVLPEAVFFAPATRLLATQSPPTFTVPICASPLTAVEVDVVTGEDVRELHAPADADLANGQVGRRALHGLAAGADDDGRSAAGGDVADEAAFDGERTDVVAGADGGVEGQPPVLLSMPETIEPPMLTLAIRPPSLLMTPELSSDVALVMLPPVQL